MRRFHYEQITKWVPDDALITSLFQNPIVRPRRHKPVIIDSAFVAITIIESLIVDNPLIRPGRKKFVLDFLVVNQDFPFITEKAEYVAFTGINPQAFGGTL